MATVTANEQEVLDVLNRYLEAYRRRDVDAAVACFASDPDLVVIGTGADERRVGPDAVREQIERDVAQSDSMSVSVGWTAVSARESVGWVAAEATVHATVNGQAVEMPVRLTAVAERAGDGWRLVQAHLSTADAAQPAGESFVTS